jgi:signal transduction histidine kinase
MRLISGRKSKLDKLPGEVAKVDNSGNSLSEDHPTYEWKPLDTLTDNLPSAFVLLDSNLRVLIASSAIREIGEWGKVESRNRYCAKLMCGIEPCDVCRTEKALQTGQIQSFAFAVGNGSATGERHFEHLAIPVAGRNGDRQVLVVLTDITDKVTTWNRLARAEKLSAVGEMAAVLSHGFRNSLTSLKMILQMHIESLNPDDSEADSLKVALDSVTGMEGIVGQLLSFASNRKLARHEQDLNLLIREVAELSRRKLQSEEVRLMLDLEPALESVQLDDSQVKEAIMNLILNACEAMKGGGDIIIRTSNCLIGHRDHTGYIERPSGASQSGIVPVPISVPAVSVEISDQGEGIAPENLERIFDPFFTTKINGTGLGLAIAKRTAVDHGGSIHVETGTKGSKFTLIFPLGGNDRAGRDNDG